MQTPGQMAALVIAGQLPDLILGLFVGTWVDRGQHRVFLVGSDLGRALLLAIIPTSAALGVLSFPLLIGVAFESAALSVFFDAASVAVLPSIVPREQVVDANTKLSMSDAVIALGGPGIAGTLVQVMTAPKAILVDAFSFLVSGLTLKGIGSPDASTRNRGPRQSLLLDIREGLRELIATLLLRSLTISSAVFAAGLVMQGTVLMLFLTRTLTLSPATIGFVLMIGGAGSLIGGTLLEVLATCAIPISALIDNPLPLLASAQVVNGIGIAIYAINNVSLRQHIVRPELLGRITASRRFLTFCVAPLGAILGATIADRYGLAETLYVAAAFLLVGATIMWISPVRTIRRQASHAGA